MPQPDPSIFIHRLFVLGVLVILFGGDVAAQQALSYSFRNITRDDGLNHDEVYDIGQDGNGFIWVLARNGLQRYDGTRFLNVNPPSKRGAYVPDVNSNLHFYQNNTRLWINSGRRFSSIGVFDFSVIDFPVDETLAHSSARIPVYQDKAGHQMKFGNNFYFHYIEADKRFMPAMYVPDAASIGVASYFATDPLNHVTWLASSTTGLRLLDSATHRIYTAADNPLGNKILQAFYTRFGDASYQVSEVMRNSNGDLWVTTFGESFYRYDARLDKVITYSLNDMIRRDSQSGSVITDPPVVTDMLLDAHGTLWITTENAGLLQYVPSGDTFRVVGASNSSDRKLPSRLYNIFQDNQGSLWLGTNSGIMIFNPYREGFRTIRHDNNVRSLVKGEITDYIQSKSGDIFVGTWGGGITIFDHQWKFKENIVLDGHVDYNLIWCFAEGDDGRLWIGAQHGFVHRYNPTSKALETLHPPELKNSTVRCITKDRHGNLWFGLHNGAIALWRKSEDKFYACDRYPGEKIGRAPVINIFFDRRDQCWVGTESSVGLFTDTCLSTPGQAPSSEGALEPGNIQGIASLTDSTLLVATLNDGLKSVNTYTRAFCDIDVADMPSLRNVYAILPDDKDNIWFTSDYAVYRFSPNNLRTFAIDRETIHAAFSNKSFYVLANGEWITSTYAEIIRFHPDSLEAATGRQVPVRITSLQLADSTLILDSLINHHAPLRLQYHQNFFTIEWATLEYSGLTREQFYYRLENIDQEWINAKGSFAATYTNLPPGTYTFEVRVGDRKPSGDFNTLVIRIAPPFWRTWWFLTALIVICLVSVYAIIRWRLQVLQSIQNEKTEAQKARIDMLSMNEKLSVAKLEGLRSQMNPHFIFNCLTSIDNLIQSGDTEKATTYLAKFARLMRSILETSRMTTVQCWKDMETLRMYIDMEELRWDSKFTCAIHVSREILTGDYKVPPLLIQPFVENAIHHGLLNKRTGDRDLVIDVWATQHHIHYIIRDNGVGRAQAAAYRQLNRSDHQSMGIQIAIDRINLLNHHDDTAIVITDLFDDQQQPAGTQVEVNIINQP